MRRRAERGRAIVKTVQRVWVFPILAAWFGSVRAAEPADSAGLQFFENKIRPIFVESCLGCHGEQKHKANLRLDSRDGMLTGGDSGPAVVPGNPDESLLIEAVKYESFEMPPTGKLGEDKIALLREWVAMGAPFPGVAGDAAAPRAADQGVTDEDRQFWSFRPLARPTPPSASAQERNNGPIDAFVAASLDQAGLRGSPEATSWELARRLSFDLIGLPPDADFVDALEASAAPDVWSRVVDRMLASPRYGERWGRHWLDVVRFAQTNGYERDAEKPFAWRYRDYVIESLNADKPYDQFIREQVAGDELDESTDEGIVATGFLRLGVWDDEPDDAKTAEFEEYDDIVSTLGQAVLGLTIGCARCHDHKFDPISQQDYYGLVAFFRNMRLYEKHVGDKTDFSMLVKLPGGGEALAIREHGPTAPATHVLVRGDARSPSSEVSPSFPEVLCESRAAATADVPPPAEGAATTGRRRRLAEWLTRPENPLAPRVISNRLWHHHFGQGIVATPSDFGKSGDRPSHPELLDWLAGELVEGEWRLKRLHRMIVESATYRQSSRIADAEAEAADPSNRLLWRQTMRRLDAESIRDAILATSGRLNLEMGGRGVFPDLAPEVLATQSIPGNGWDKSPLDQQSRRSVYIFVKRTLRPPLLESLDAATPDQPIGARPVTTIAPQALLLLNSSFIQEQSEALAESLESESSADEDVVRALFRRALGREASETELATAARFLRRQTEEWWNRSEDEAPAARRRALAELCKLAMNLNAFVYVD